MTQKKPNDSVASGIGALYPALVVAVVLGAAYYFGVLGRFNFGPKTEASKVWLVTYLDDEIT
ncbi:hypothetical protein BMP26_005373, partial [Escherichia coli]|nr:hypothetical protein [Escherichia coli]